MGLGYDKPRKLLQLEYSKKVYDNFCVSAPKWHFTKSYWQFKMRMSDAEVVQSAFELIVINPYRLRPLLRPAFYVHFMGGLSVPCSK